MALVRVCRGGALGVAFSAAVASAASAQTVRAAWQDLQLTLPAGTLVEINTTDQRNHRGAVESIAGDELMLREGGTTVRIPRAEVARVSKRGDSLRNGAIIGVIAGAAGAAVWGGDVFALCASEGGVNCLRSNSAASFFRSSPAFRSAF